MSSTEIQTKARELKELKVMKDELEAEIAAIEDILKAAMGEQEEMLCGEYKLTYQTVSTSRFDSTRFKKEHADLAAAYTALTTRRISVRRNIARKNWSRKSAHLLWFITRDWKRSAASAITPPTFRTG